MKFFRFENMDYAAYKHETYRNTFVIDIFHVLDMSAVQNKKVQRFAEELFIAEPEAETDYVLLFEDHGYTK